MDVELPEGWTQKDKQVVVYHFHCPWAVECGNDTRMFTKDSFDEAIKLGGQHLFDKNLHPNMLIFDTIVEAETAAEAGITEDVEVRPVFFDEDGNEQELPPKKPDDDNASDKGGPRRQRKQQSRAYHRYRNSRRSRSRSKRRSRSRSRARDGGVRAGSWRAGSSSLVPIGALTTAMRPVEVQARMK